MHIPQIKCKFFSYYPSELLCDRRGGTIEDCFTTGIIEVQVFIDKCIGAKE